MRPVEGTILTVVRVGGRGGRGARDTGEHGARRRARRGRAPRPVHAVAAHARDAAGAAGRRRRRRGRVSGFTLLLDAFLEVVDGPAHPRARRSSPTPLIGRGARRARRRRRRCATRSCTCSTPTDATIPAFKRRGPSLGDSIVVVGGDGLWNCHVHTDDIGGAIEAGIEAGRPRNIRVTDLLEQVEEEQWVRARRAALAPHRATAPPRTWSRPRWSRSAVGDGVRRLLASLGVQEIVAGGQSMNPSTAQILEAVERCPADSVIVLPEQQEHRAGGPPGRRADVASRSRSSPRTRWWRRSPRCVAYDPRRRRSTSTSHAMIDAVGRACRRGRGDAGGARHRRASAGRSGKGDWIAISRDGICVATRLRGRGRVRARRRARRRGQRDRDRARRRRRPPRRDRSGVREHLAFAHPAGGGRGARRRSAALPVPDRGGVATAARAHAPQPGHDPARRRRRASRPELLDSSRSMNAADRVRARPPRALPAPLPRPHAPGRDRRARGRARRRRSSPRCSACRRA